MRDLLRGMGEELRKEWPSPHIILVPLEIAGIDQVLDSCIVLLTRLKTCRSNPWR